MTRLALFAAALLIDCTSDRAQRLVGTDFAEIGPILQCGKESGIDFVGFSVVRMSIEDARAIAADPERLMRFPELNQSITGLKLVRWRSGPLSEEGKRVFELAVEGLVGDCEDAEKVHEQILLALSKTTTFHSYEFLPIDGHVAPEALRFRILDLEGGIVYELENLS